MPQNLQQLTTSHASPVSPPGPVSPAQHRLKLVLQSRTAQRRAVIYDSSILPGIDDGSSTVSKDLGLTKE